MDTMNKIATVIEEPSGFTITRISAALLLLLFCAASAFADMVTEGSVLHSFDDPVNCSSQAGDLVVSSDESIYGVKTCGGNNGSGALFKATAAGSYEVLYDFPGPDASTGRCSPCYPTTILEGSDGNLYIGATESVGYRRQATLKATKTKPSAVTLLAATPDWAATSETYSMVEGADGALYGLAGGGATEDGSIKNGLGAFFKVTKAGVWSQLHVLAGGGSEGGSVSWAQLVLAPDGKMYGALPTGGPADASGNAGKGTIFSISTDGIFKNEITFYDSTLANYGRNPSALALGADNRLYGISVSGGTDGAQNPLHPEQPVDGVFFRYVPGSAPEPLYVFGNDHVYASLEARMILGPDGKFYVSNTAVEGGQIFRIGSGGDVDFVHQFQSSDSSGKNDTGKHPQALVTGTDRLYALTAIGGNSGRGTLTQLFPSTASTDLSFFLSSDNVSEGSRITASWNSAAKGCLSYGGSGSGFTTSDPAWANASRPASGSESHNVSNFGQAPKKFIYGLSCYFGNDREVTASRSLLMQPAGSTGGGTSSSSGSGSSGSSSGSGSGGGSSSSGSGGSGSSSSSSSGGTGSGSGGTSSGGASNSNESTGGGALGWGVLLLGLVALRRWPVARRATC